MIVLLCPELERLGSGLDLVALEAALSQQSPSVEVRRAPEPCERSSAWLDPGLKGAGRLVLGLCSSDGERHELHAQARKIGLDPFTIEVVSLGAFCALTHPRSEATDKARLLLGAAVAKARAARGTGPDNAKPLLSWEQQVSRRALFTLPPIRYEMVPSIRQEACAVEDGCRVCANACPHGALTLSGDGRMTVNKTPCTGCGACVSVCPRGAFDFPGASVSEIEAQVAELLNAAPRALRPRGVVFTCQRSAPALDRIARNGGAWAPGWCSVEVACVGMVTPTWLLQCLNLGAGAVAVLPCHHDDCCFGQPEKVWGRFEYVREMLRMLGISPERVRFLDPTDSAGLARELASIPEDLTERREGSPAAGFFSPTATAQALLELRAAGQSGRERSLAHPYSPLGVVDIAGGCTACGACVHACPTGSLALEQDGDGVALTFEARLCIGCGGCAPVCPERVLSVRRMTDLERLFQGKLTLYRSTEARCEACGEPIASREMLRRIGALLGEDRAMDVISRYCLACRGAAPRERLARDGVER